MRGTSRLLAFASALLLGIVVSAVAYGQVCAPSPVTLESNEFYTARSSNEVEFHPGIYWESVEGASPSAVVVRYGFTADEAVVAAAALYCRCYQPTICVENDCKVTGEGTGNAKCRGGCYRANGEACVSCRFFSTETD
jgi:hypothetical protein